MASRFSVQHPAYQIVVCGAGAVVLGLATRLPSGSPGFYVLTAVLGAIWLTGAWFFGFPRDVERHPVQSPGRALVFSLLLGGGLTLVFIGGAFLLVHIPVLREPVEGLLRHASNDAIWIVTPLTVITGACEELYFRGALFDRIKPDWQILGTTLAYTAVTAAGGIVLLTCAAAALGFVTALARRYIGPVWVCVLIHVIWSVSMPYVLPVIF